MPVLLILIPLLLQGRNKRGSSAWVSHYHVSYSEDAYSWEWARDIYGDKKVQYRAKCLLYCSILSHSGAPTEECVAVAEWEHGRAHGEGLLPGAPRHRKVSATPIQSDFTIISFEVLRSYFVLY